jgi:hypothetical protein
VAKELPDGMAIVALNPGVINTDMLASCFGSSAAMYQAPEAWYEFSSIIIFIPSFWCLCRGSMFSLKAVLTCSDLDNFVLLTLLLRHSYQFPFALAMRSLPSVPPPNRLKNIEIICLCCS